MRAVVALAAAVAVVFCASPAAAQSRRTYGFIEITAASNVGIPAAVTQDHQFTEFLESADVASVIRQKRGVRASARAGWWFARRIGIAAGVSVLHASGTVQGVYAFPSPFVFNAPVTGTASAAARRTSVDTEIDVITSLVDARGWQVTGGVGPDIARVRQPLLADVLVATYDFPFTSIAFAPASGQSRGTAVGVHVVATVARHVGRWLDLTGTIDFRRTPVHLTDADGTVTVDPGGVTAGGGLRIRF
jgi:hypothetical protein